MEEILLFIRDMLIILANYLGALVFFLTTALSIFIMLGAFISALIDSKDKSKH